MDGPVILARWDGRRKAWSAKAPGYGWTRVPFPCPLPKAAPADLFAAVRRMYGHQATRGGRIEIVAGNEG